MSIESAKTSNVVSIGTGSTVVAGANRARSVLILTNTGSNIIDVQLATSETAAPTAVATQGARLQPNSPPLVLAGYTGAVAAIAQTGATPLGVIEL